MAVLVGHITENWNSIIESIKSSGPIIKELWEATGSRATGADFWGSRGAARGSQKGTGFVGVQP